MIPLILVMLLGSAIPAAKRVEATAPGVLLVGSQGSPATPEILSYNAATHRYISAFVHSGLTGLDPLGMTIGPDHNLYVAVTNGLTVNEVRRYNWRTGAMDVFAKGGGLWGPSNVVFGPDGNLYVSSYDNGKVIRFHGKTGAPMGVFAHGGGLQGPEGLAFGPDGNLYVVDYDRAAVVRYKGSDGAYMDTFVPKGSAGLGTPSDLKFGPDRNLYVTGATFGGRLGVFRFDGQTGAFIDMFVSLPDSEVPIDLVFGDRHLFVTVGGSNAGVIECDATTGKSLETFTQDGDGGLENGYGLAYDPE
jgi:DNA-binding beta-propeller fold protein YncE